MSPERTLSERDSGRRDLDQGQQPGSPRAASPAPRVRSRTLGAAPPAATPHGPRYSRALTVAKGLTNADVAARLVISRTTVRTHLENVFDKLNENCTAAVAWLNDETESLLAWDGEANVDRASGSHSRTLAQPRNEQRVFVFRYPAGSRALTV